MKKIAKSNMNYWGESDPRWKKTWWHSYRTYHYMQDKFFEEFVAINAHTWANEDKNEMKEIEAALRQAWKECPYRYGIHGVCLYDGEQKKFFRAYQRIMKNRKAA